MGKADNPSPFLGTICLKGDAMLSLEFKNEVALIAKLQHRNLVKTFRLLYKGEEMMLALK
ncbi:hypothetical protein DVH24_005505 [Malus domestica]|uniref:Serine-threonine/tyrosine-protein kinase catalytic domain-containing protein n=1 Tax=Malus domestica TaxID=3750 RepID=A0A498KUX3_MALDO|nr:hypothetical protein DVH24_005505 [Malus domestica]